MVFRDRRDIKSARERNADIQEACCVLGLDSREFGVDYIRTMGRTQSPLGRYECGVRSNEYCKLV